MKILFILILFIGAQSHGASRVISLSPAVTEMVFALGLEKNLVGVSEFSDYPPQAKSLPQVGPYAKPDAEKIVSLKPDLALLPVEGSEDIRFKLMAMKVPYAILSMKNLKEIGQAAVTIGALLGDKARGLDFEKKWNADLTAIFKKFEKNDPKIPRPRALLEIQREPLIIAGQGTFLDEIVARCGAENIFHLEKGYPRTSLEAAIAAKPDIIIMVDFFENVTAQKRAEALWREISVLKNTRLAVLNPDYTTRPGPRLLRGVHDICDAVWAK